MKKSFSCLALIIFLFSCGQHENRKNEIGNESSSSTINRLERWLDYYKLKIGDFKDSSPITELETYTIDYNFKTDSDKSYLGFFVFSPDHTKFIDLDSYNNSFDQDEKGQLVYRGKDVDTDIALVDLKENKRYRILFCGTDCPIIFEEAHWVQNNLVYLVGFYKKNKLWYPTLWAFETNSHILQEIDSGKAFSLPQLNYIEKVRLKK